MKFTKTPQQLDLESLGYQYIMDICSILSQNDGFLYPRRVHVGLWREIDKLASERRLVVCSQIEKEVKRGARDDLAKEWLNISGVRIIVESPGVQQCLRQIVNAQPKLLKFGDTRECSSGDAFLIATAMFYNLAIITEEKKTSPYIIPQVASSFGIKTYSLNELAEENGWEFS